MWRIYFSPGSDVALGMLTWASPLDSTLAQPEILKQLSDRLSCSLVQMFMGTEDEL